MAEPKGELTVNSATLKNPPKKQDEGVTGVQWDAPVSKHVNAGRNIMVAGIGTERAECDRII